MGPTGTDQARAMIKTGSGAREVNATQHPELQLLTYAPYRADGGRFSGHGTEENRCVACGHGSIAVPPLPVVGARDSTLFVRGFNPLPPWVGRHNPLSIPIHCLEG